MAEHIKTLNINLKSVCNTNVTICFFYSLKCNALMNKCVLHLKYQDLIKYIESNLN